MLQVIQNGKVQMIVLNEGDEIIVTTSNKKTGYVSLYNKGDGMVVDGTITKNNYNIPYKERKAIEEERANKIKEYKHKKYLEKKQKMS